MLDRTRTTRASCFYEDVSWKPRLSKRSPFSSISNLAWIQSPSISVQGPPICSCRGLPYVCQAEFKHDGAARRAVFWPEPACRAAAYVCMYVLTSWQTDPLASGYSWCRVARLKSVKTDNTNMHSYNRTTRTPAHIATNHHTATLSKCARHWVRNCRGPRSRSSWGKPLYSVTAEYRNRRRPDSVRIAGVASDSACRVLRPWTLPRVTIPFLSDSGCPESSIRFSIVSEW